MMQVGRLGLAVGRFGRSPAVLLGAELVANGDFAADANWTKGSGWSIAGGVATITGASGSPNLSQDVGLIAGRYYRFVITVTRSAGGVALYAGLAGVAFSMFASGTYEARLRAAGTSLIYIQAGNGFTGTIDNVSCRRA